MNFVDCFLAYAKLSLVLITKRVVKILHALPYYIGVRDDMKAAKERKET